MLELRYRRSEDEIFCRYLDLNGKRVHYDGKEEQIVTRKFEKNMYDKDGQTN